MIPDRAFTKSPELASARREFDKALAQAHKALELGFDRPTLKGRLQAANKWEEPPAAEPAPAASAASATAAATAASPASAASEPAR